MEKYRIHFIKTGRSAYASHLDLMRTMHRALLRAGLPLRYSEGFNPHPVMSILMPLPLGMQSRCELMDIKLREDIPPENLAGMINPMLPEGIEILDAYEAKRKVKEIKWHNICGCFFYDDPCDGLAQELREFFGRKSIIITKRTKRGEGELDIAPWIINPVFTAFENKISIKCTLSAQEPTVSPELLTSALRQLSPILSPKYAQFVRVECLDSNMEIFR